LPLPDKRHINKRLTPPANRQHKTPDVAISEWKTPSAVVQLIDILPFIVMVNPDDRHVDGMLMRQSCNSRCYQG